MTPFNITSSLSTLLMIQNYPPGAGQPFANPSLWSIPVEVEYTRSMQS